MAMAATSKDEIKTLTTHYIDGAFVESHGREVIDAIKPTNGKVIARVTLADEEDTRRAIAAAKRGFATYGRSTREERAELLRRLHAAAAARVDELTAAMVEEYGGVVQFARLIVESGVVAGRMFKARPASHSEHKVVGPHNFYNVLCWNGAACR
jgi:aldehyde dehydrogenase (NAD+)